MTTAASKVTAQVTADDIDEDNGKGMQLLDKDAERSTPRLPGAIITRMTSSVVRLPLSIKERAAALYHDPPGWFPLALLCANQFFFAMMHVVAKPALHYIPPIALAMMRISLALPFLFLIAWKEGALQKIGRRDARYMLLLGLVGVALPQTLVFVANKLAGPNIVAIMSPAAPVYAAIFASALKLERLTRVKVGGILLAVSGALVVLRPDKMVLSQGHANDTTAGICVMVLQTMSYAGFLVALKIKLQTHPFPFALYAYASLIGVSIIIIVGVISGTVFFSPSSIPRSAWYSVLYCGFVISFCCHSSQAWAVAHTSASLPALFSCLSPFLTGFLAYIFLGTTLGSASDIIGLLLNVSGLMAVIYSKMRLEGPMPVIAAAPEADAADQDHADDTTGPVTELPAVTTAPAPAKGSLSLSRSGTLKTVPEEASSRPATPAAS